MDVGAEGSSVAAAMAYFAAHPMDAVAKKARQLHSDQREPLQARSRHKFSCANMLQRVVDRHHYFLDLAAQQIGARRRETLVRNVGEGAVRQVVDLVHVNEPGAARPHRSEVHALGPGKLHELLRVLHAHARMGDEQERNQDHPGDRNEVLAGVVRHLCAKDVRRLRILPIAWLIASESDTTPMV